MKNTFAFLFYEDERNGEDAIRELNGFEIKGVKLTVQTARTSRERLNTDQLEQLKDKRVIVENCDARTSWQDLKDWARAAGTVSFTNTFMRDGKKYGVVEFEGSTNLRDAMRTLENIQLHGTDVRVEKVFTNLIFKFY